MAFYMGDKYVIRLYSNKKTSLLFQRTVFNMKGANP